jgi:hypothetical protein
MESFLCEDLFKTAGKGKPAPAGFFPKIENRKKRTPKVEQESVFRMPAAAFISQRKVAVTGADAVPFPFA